MARSPVGGRAADADLLDAAADAIERWAALGRSPWDVCYCGHHREDHLGDGVGCIGTGYMWCDDECRRFRVHREDKLGPRNRALVDQLRHAARDLRIA